MRLPRTILRLACGLFAIAAPPAVAADDFTIVVTEILDRQSAGPLSLMSDEQRQAMTACVSSVLADLPDGSKREIVDGGTFEEREARFGKVLYENHAEWLQKVAGGCAALAFR
jgi:hypothetical protein